MLESAKAELRRQIDAAIARIEAKRAAEPEGSEQLDEELKEQLRNRRDLDDEP